MPTDVPETCSQIRSLVTADAELQLSLQTVEVPDPAPGQVIVRVEAAPINPSDLGLLLAGADMESAAVSGTDEHPIVTAAIPPAAMRMMAGRVGESMPVGNEGAGTVVAAGSSPEAQALVGRTVSLAGGAMYTQYRCVDAAICLVLPEGTSARDGASSFVNPLTALGMVETMRMEGHTGLVHTAAASNLGQMLNRVCIEDQIPLVNIVRKPEQEEILRSAGATYVCDSSKAEFMSELIEALKATGATLAFDAVGGGKLASQILTCMEAAASSVSSGYSRYGSTVHKQVYIYGGLDRGPTELTRSFGFAWGVGGWLLTPFLQKIGPQAGARLRERVATELTTTFASSYTAEVSLAGALSLNAIAAYGRQATGSKYLINPNA
ncbi:MAG TPA: zinc-binding dehydrogenase [Acidimicrobiales bacterium]|nr:zinc-binding dehydrogenase [Acidimicrobiales bacterium]